MLDVATMVNLALDHRDRRRGWDSDHRQSPHGYSANSTSPLGEHSRDQDEGDLRNIILNKDARYRIENRHQERGHAERE
jgi:hypothetical protein